MTAQNAAERALVAARQRGTVDEQLLAVLRRERVLCGVDEVEGGRRPAARQVGEMTAVLGWTSAERARAAGWSGALAEQSGQAVADLLVGTGLGLALNAGDDIGVGLDAPGVARLARSAEVPAGATVYLGEPSVPLEALETRLAEELTGVGAVDEARIAMVVTDPGGDARVTVVLTLRPDAGARQVAAAQAACDRAAAAAGLAQLDVVVDDQLGGLRAAALALPLAYSRDAR